MIKALTIDATFLNLSRPDFQYYDFEYYRYNVCMHFLKLSKSSHFRPKLRSWISKWGMMVADQKFNQTFNLKHPVWASKIRLVPHRYSNEVPCISLELFGCLWTKGIISYEMPVNDLGDKKCYDGKTEGGFKKNGKNNKILTIICIQNFLVFFYRVGTIG